MKLSLNLRNWGPQSTTALIRECAGAVDETGLDTLWVNEHQTVRVDSGADAPADFALGRWLDPLTTLAFLAGITQRVGLGTAVLLLPLRPPWLAAKELASIQELSGERLRVGVGVGWFEAEFKVLGVPHSERGARTDRALELLQRCFASDEVETAGERVLFRPRPARPPLLIGGAPGVALPRAVRFGDGWIPAGVEPDVLEAQSAELQRQAAEAGRGPLDVVAMKTLPLDDPAKAIAYAERFARAGAGHLVHTQGYVDAAEYRRVVEVLEERIRPALRDL